MVQYKDTPYALGFPNALGTRNGVALLLTDARVNPATWPNTTVKIGGLLRIA